METTRLRRATICARAIGIDMRNITVRTHLRQLRQALGQQQWSGAVLAGAAGAVAFAGVLLFVSFGGLATAAPEPVAGHVQAEVAPPLAVNQLIEPNHTIDVEPTLDQVIDKRPDPRLAPGRVAIGVPLSADNAPLSEIRVGATLDILAALPETADGPGRVGPAVSGARVAALRQSGDQLVALLDLPGDAAVQLGHLVRLGVAVTYVARTDTANWQEIPSLTTDEARARLGLAARPSSAPTPPAPIPIPTPEPPNPQPAHQEVSEVHFVTYPGIELDTIEQRFDIDEETLLAANPDLPSSGELAPGTEVVLPDLYGFFYRVQPTDTWKSLSDRYHLSADWLQKINGMPPGNTQLHAGDGLLIPANTPAWATAPRGPPGGSQPDG